jgi:lipopolysaccharide/colanic/teichoic acid biosynthesis glycosyltransferase
MEVVLRKHILLLADCICVAVSPATAIFIRDNLEFSIDRFYLVMPYSIIGVISGTGVLLIAGMHRGLWSYASLPDLLKVVGAATATVLVTMFLAFNLNWLEGLPRSVPVIQWFVLVAVLCGARVSVGVVRHWIWRSQRRAPSGEGELWSPQPEHVVVVGLNRLTSLYLGSVAELAPGRLSVVGVLAEGAELRGRQVNDHKILGAPEELLQVLARYETHGIVIDRLVLTVPIQRLSSSAREALVTAESMGVSIDLFAERLGLSGGRDDDAPRRSIPIRPKNVTAMTAAKTGTLGAYKIVKRGIDFIGAAVLAVVSAPFAALVALVVLADVGWPILFWQQRPGRYGRQFKLNKFRTMSPSHDEDGVCIPEHLRTSCVGRFLRRSRLDELPQFYNILAGDMSFVGPRPLLASEQFDVGGTRLQVRPGLTGWAQIHGGRDAPIEEKATLDIWYINRMSLWLDIIISLGTVRMIIMGDRRDAAKVKEAMEDLILHQGNENMSVEAPEALAKRPVDSSETRSVHAM